MITGDKLWQVKKIMNLEETVKILKLSEDMSKTTKNNGRPEGSIYEQFGYTPYSDVYPNISGVSELYEIGIVSCMEE